MNPNQAIEDARASLHQGKAADAERRLRSALAEHPGHSAVLHLLGLIAYRQGDLRRAREHLDEAVESAPDDGEIQAHLCEILRNLEEHDAAIAAGREAVRLRPEAAPAHNNLGLALFDAGNLTEAEEAFRHALETDPGYAKGHYNLGNLLRRSEQPEAAEASLREALRLQPRYPQALNALGVVLDELGRDDEAARAFNQAIRLAPRYHKPLLNYGNLFARLKRFDKAHSCYEQAITLKKDYLEAWLAKATLFQQQERYPDALEALKRAARLHPDDPDVPFRVGQVHFARFAYPEAIAAFERALELDPEHGGAICAKAQARGEACLWEDRDLEIETVRRAVVAAREAGTPSPLPPFVTFLPFEPLELLALARDSAERTFREAQVDRAALGPSAARQQRPAPERVRLAYLSSDFRNHAVAQMTRSVYGLHDRDRFEVIAYSLGPDDGSDYRRGIASDCDSFVDLREATDMEVARRIRADGVHILVDLTGFTRGAQPGILARRPAPIQVSWLYPATTGGVFHDYLIGDPIVTPPEHAEHFGEKLVLLPHCYHATDHRQPIARETPSRADEGLPEDGFVFCCFNKLAKIDPGIFAVWMRILDRVPNSVLWIADGPGVDNLRREAEALGVAGDRLRSRRFADTKALHLARHRLAQLFLDTRVFSAHTTAADALWSGVPVLTCPGETFASRVAASMLEAVGLPEMIAPDLETYESRAVHLARQPELLRAVRRQLRARRKMSPLFSTPRFVRNLERAYLAMWERYRAGENPGMLVISDSDQQ
jgi:predicted O-linked N-acetylglucosamine transferase (SPINDLY family)